MRSASAANVVDARHRAAVRQAQKQHVHALERLGARELQRRAAPQIGVREVDELAVEPLAGHLRHVEPRMAEQEPKQLAAGVAGGADDGGDDELETSVP